MKYTVVADENAAVTLRSFPGDETVVMTLDDGQEYWFDLDQFKDFRKAIGYVWQEIEKGDE